MERPDSPDAGKAAAKNEAEAEIEQFKRLVDGANVEHVEEPSSRKDVEIAYTGMLGHFIEEEGEAIGVYYEPGRRSPETVHIDWADERDRTSVPWSRIETLEEGEYYEVDDE